jgi:Flp pilus assembly protein TadG
MNGSHRQRSDRGAAALELALVLPLLLTVVFGLVDFARAYNAQQAVTASAREGVRIVALNGTDADAAARAKAAGAPIPASDLSVAITKKCSAGSPGTAAHVTVTYTFHFLTPLPAFVPGLGSTRTLTGQGEMRCGG